MKTRDGFNGTVEWVGDNSVRYDNHGLLTWIGPNEVSYNSDGTLSWVGSNRVTYDDNGRLKWIGANQVSYDDYGRVKWVGSHQVSYNYKEVSNDPRNKPVGVTYNPTLWKGYPTPLKPEVKWSLPCTLI